VCRQLLLAVKLGSDLATHPYSPLWVPLASFRETR
jgi:hypothetical protein